MLNPLDDSRYCFTCMRDVSEVEANTHEKLKHDVQEMPNGYFQIIEEDAYDQGRLEL